MTTPPDDELPPDLAEEARRGDDQIRKMFEEKKASLSPEEWRRWCQRKLEWLVRAGLDEVSIERPPEGDGNSKG